MPIYIDEMNEILDTLWYLYDKDGDGYINKRESVALFNHIFAEDNPKGLTQKQLDGYFKTINTKNDGKITKDELGKLILSISN